MRVLSIGLDSNIGNPDFRGHAVAWIREMARHVEEYVEIGPAAGTQSAGPVRLADNASSWVLAGSPWTYPWRAARLAATLHAQKPFDVVTTEDPIRTGLAGVLFVRRTGVPLNVENHSFHINEPVWLREKPHHRVYNRIAIAVCRRADSIRNYSAGQSRVLREIGVQDARIFTVPINAPELTPMAPDEARRQLGLGGEPLVLGVGRMVAYKNIPLLLRAFDGLPKDLGAKMLLVGSGSAKPAWQRLCTQMGLDDRVTWCDAVPWRDMVAYYSAAAVFAAPAVHETGPRTVLEALLCDCPVVLTPEMGVVRNGICVDGKSALVVPPDDIGGWTRALERLLRDPQSGRAMARSGRARIGPDISFAGIAKRLVQVLEATVELARA